MRRSIITFAAAITALTLGVRASTQQPLLTQNQHTDHRPKVDPSFPQQGALVNDDSTVKEGMVHGVNLADTLTMERKAGVWWDYARDISAVEATWGEETRTRQAQFEDAEMPKTAAATASTTRLLASGSTRSTLFVPVDSAIMKMARKPHQNVDGSSATDEQARSNVERFISAHIVPDVIDLPTSSPAQTLLEGLQLEVRQEGEGWRVIPGDIPVISIKEASNGRILYIDRVVEY